MKTKLMTQARLLAASLLVGISMSTSGQTLSSIQSIDSTRAPGFLGGSVTVTNNGISLLPNFSLNKPAGLIEMNVGRRLTFDPQYRFALEGKPWSMIFWARYKVVRGQKFRLGVGGHPSLVFRTDKITNNGVTTEMITAQRYVAGEIAPNYHFTKTISVGLYYLQGRGFKESAVRRTYFLAANANFSSIPLYKKLFMRFFPQVYYLKQDARDGFYATGTVTLSHRTFPVSIQSIYNKAFRTEIPGNDPVWNVSLIYSFGRQYAALK